MGACDFDFGASPNLIGLGFGHYVGIGRKDGTYYLLDRLTFSLRAGLATATASRSSHAFRCRRA